jgi:hypothetical protein
MAGPRDYTRSTLMALGHFGGGLCYWPGCTESVLKDVEEWGPRSIAEIAHIRAAYRNGARYDELMTNDERRDFKNLILLCDPHHDIADDKKKEHIYTVEVLTRWKEQREADPREALSRLREVTPSGLRKIVADGLAQRDSQILDALGRLENKDQRAAALMRTLLDELTEAYSLLDSGALNPYVVSELSEATETLYGLREILSEFTEAIQAFDFRRLPRNFEEY